MTRRLASHTFTCTTYVHTYTHVCYTHTYVCHISHWELTCSAGSLSVHPAVAFATAATHNNFSFNFSILSVIYTCHAMTELGPVPGLPSPTPSTWFVGAAAAVAGFSFHTLRTWIYFALKGNHRKQRMVCSFHAVVVFCMPVIKSSAGATRAAAAAWSKKRLTRIRAEQSENQHKSSTGARAVAACGQQ